MQQNIIWTSLNAAAEEILANEILEKEKNEVSEFERDENEKYGNITMLPMKNLVASPIGLISVSDAMSPFKHYKIWQCDTTRRLTNELYLKLKQIDGIEVIKPLTPYKFLVAPGLAFKFRDVRTRVESLIRDEVHLFDMVTENKVNKLKVELSRYEEFCLFISPNGEIDYSYLEKDKSNLEEYNKWKETYKSAEQMSNALVIESNLPKLEN
jgi:hypothetical protein